MFGIHKQLFCPSVVKSSIIIFSFQCFNILFSILCLFKFTGTHRMMLWFAVRTILSFTSRRISWFLSLYLHHAPLMHGCMARGGLGLPKVSPGPFQVLTFYTMGAGYPWNSLMAISGVSNLQGGWPAAALHPFSHPTPYAYALMRKWFAHVTNSLPTCQDHVTHTTSFTQIRATSLVDLQTKLLRSYSSLLNLVFCHPFLAL
jgi:hypothetical protein